MKKILIATTLAALLETGVNADEMTATMTNNTPTAEPLSRPGGSTAGRFGAGLILGEPTGASLKYWLNSTMAVDGAVGWSFHEETDLYLHSDVLWHKFDLIPVSRGQLPFYVGAGARWKIRDDKDDRFGARIPVGLSYIFDDIPVDVFLEVAPIIDFAPSTRGGFTAGIGARFWF